MIPKKIHYCWFGGNPLTAEVKCYIDTWRKFCPDYEIIEWNESNFDINENAYCREAYEAKKWAFVTDYVRLKVLYEHGGIYMDTDVEVCKNLDPLLEYGAVSGYETNIHIQTATMAACRRHEWICMLLRDYDNRSFVKANGEYDFTTNVEVITRLTKDEYNIELDGEKKVFGNNITLLPFECLCAKTFDTGEIVRSEKTFTIHHFSGSWIDDDMKAFNAMYKCYYEHVRWLPSAMLRSKVAAAITIFKTNGLAGVMKRIKRNIVNG